MIFQDGMIFIDMYPMVPGVRLVSLWLGLIHKWCYDLLSKWGSTCFTEPKQLAGPVRQIIGKQCKHIQKHIMLLAHSQKVLPFFCPFHLPSLWGKWNDFGKKFKKPGKVEDGRRQWELGHKPPIPYNRCCQRACGWESRKIKQTVFQIYIYMIYLMYKSV